MTGDNFEIYHQALRLSPDMIHTVKNNFPQKMCW